MTFHKEIQPLRIAVIGYSDSGKTYATALIITALKKFNLKVAAVKHVHDETFSIDREGSDTWRMSSVGADAVAVAASNELTLIYRGQVKYESILELIRGYEYDAIVLEGFKDKALKDPNLIKVLCIKSKDELMTFNTATKGNILAVCSLKDLDGASLVLRRDDDDLKGKVMAHVKNYLETNAIVKSLPGLDCRKCGYSSCLKMAEAIKRRKANIEDCTIYNSSHLMGVEVKVNDSEIPLQPFTAKMIRSTVMGMLSCLKGVTVKGDERLKLNIIR